jgi:glycosyltransferase involved in cell wall biosynthesis
MIKKLKVLQVVRAAGKYGATTSIKNLCHVLTDRGHTVLPIVYRDGDFQGELDRDYPVRRLETSGKFSIAGILELRNLIRELKPDLVHTHLSHATLRGSFAARLARTPVIATVHGMNGRLTYNFANRLITVSQAAKQHLVGQGVHPNRISVAYNGIPIPGPEAFIRRDQVRASLNIPAEAVVLGSTSRADYSKGIQDAIAATAMLARRHSNVYFVFAGDGECLEDLRTQVKTLGIADRTRFLGFRNDVMDVLSSMDVFVFPSLKEAMGISIVEAMAMALPIVGSRIGGIPEVVDAESGILVPGNDPPALAEALHCLLEDPNEIKAMGHRARARAAEKFSLAASAEQVEDAYKILLRL